jgi:hypothetical protein
MTPLENQGRSSGHVPKLSNRHPLWKLPVQMKFGWGLVSSWGLQLAATDQGYEHSATKSWIHDVCPGEDPETLVYFTPRGLASPRSILRPRLGTRGNGNIEQNQMNQ